MTREFFFRMAAARRRPIQLAAAILAAGVLCAGALVAADVNRRAPGFSLIDAKGVEHDLADYRGKVVALAFLQTTCPHCGNAAEALQQVQEKYGARVAVVAIVNPPDSPDRVQEFIAAHKLKYPILLDSGQMAYSYVLTSRVIFPHIYLIDGGGMIRRDYQYGQDAPEVFEAEGLSAEIARLLPPGAPERK